MSHDIQEMRVHLATAELKNKRLMEAFKKTSQEVREVCYQLTGYKIDIPTHNQYRVTSMYANSPSDKLLFQVSIHGSVVNILHCESRGSRFEPGWHHCVILKCHQA